MLLILNIIVVFSHAFGEFQYESFNSGLLIAYMQIATPPCL